MKDWNYSYHGHPLITKITVQDKGGNGGFLICDFLEIIFTFFLIWYILKIELSHIN